MPRVDLGVTPEGFLDLRLYLVRADPRNDEDVVRNADDSPDVPYDPLNLVPLVCVLDFAVEHHPSGSDLRVYLALGDLGIPLQDMCDCTGDIRVGPWLSGKTDLDLVGDRPDP